MPPEAPPVPTPAGLDPIDETFARAFEAMATKCLLRHSTYSELGRPLLAERYYDAAQFARQAAARMRGEIGA